VSTEAVLRATVVAEARSHVGDAQYRDSAVKPHWPPAQFDCSTFAHWCWSKVGVDIDQADADDTWPQARPKRWRKYPGYTMTQLAALKRVDAAIKFADIEPGDLLYYSGALGGVGGSGHHVTMYIGNGRVVHAAGTAYGVIISPVVGPGQIGHGGKKLVGVASPIVLARQLGLVTTAPTGGTGTSVGAKPGKHSRKPTKGRTVLTAATYQRRAPREDAPPVRTRPKGWRFRYVRVVKKNGRTWLVTRFGSYYKAANTERGA
jgi:hypothetical protein